MALIKDGYFQDTYWASRYWQEDYWPEYGSVTGGDSARYYYMKGNRHRKDKREILLAIRELLRSLKGESESW